MKGKTDKNLFKVLKERGLLYQCTDESKLKEMLESDRPITLYEGTDPTASSLHIGHCVPYCILRRFQQAGHKVILLMGGATACIGDPSGKSEIRKILNKETIQENIEKIKETLKIFLDFEGENPAIIVNNSDWFKNYAYIDFMRDIGVHFNVNKMLSSDIYAKRIEEGGLTFFEMGYMLMQGYDFAHLNEKYGCELQWGGADQWGNIVAGVDLGRKLNFVNGADRTFVGATNPLLLTPEGGKMGKTERGAIWIDKDEISAYDFYQGVYQTPDSCVEMVFALFTDISMEKIRQMIKEDIVNAKRVLSYELTKFVRGEADAIKAQEASRALFAGAGSLENVPTHKISKQEFDQDVLVVDVAVAAGLIKSKSEGRRLIEQNGLFLNDEKVKGFDQIFSKENFREGHALLRKGKKSFIKIIVE